MSANTLTLHQPWATLVVAGVKTIETRPRRMNYRGRLYIHAGLGRPLQHFAKVGDWSYHDERMTMNGRGELRKPGSVRDGRVLVSRFDDGTAIDLPKGAVVGHVDVMDCLPIRWCRDHLDDEPDPPTMWVETATLLGNPTVMGLVRQDSALSEFDVTDQLPYGDFTPGRWAILLANPVRYDEPIPANGKQGLRAWDGVRRRDESGRL